MFMITVKVFGDPIPTGAVTATVPQRDRVEHLQVSVAEKTITFVYKLGTEDVVYGLGETMGRVNKRGGHYISFNTDTAEHEDSNPSLYASHNFLIVWGRETFGLFFDSPAKTEFWVDHQGSGELRVVCHSRDLRLYQIAGERPYEICRTFLKAIGPGYLPPRWAFGYGQSRFGYAKEQDFLDVVRGHEEKGFPLDYICMDIDYMDGFADFTFHPQRFPDPKGLVEKLKDRGIRLVPIVDAGIKIAPGDPVYESGLKGGHFCRDREGGCFRAAVWPGWTHFPDFFNTKAREWFGKQYKFYTDFGFEGFWNDMNEPAIFYSQYSRTKKLGFFLDMFLGEKRKEEKARAMERDYKSFYHDMDGRRLRHYDVHDLYGALMTRASSEGLRKLLPHRFLLFSRSSYIGAGRYGGIWTGDNTSKWEHLLLNVRHMPSLNMCGFLYSGADTGGFMGNCDRELLLRWLAFSVFTPLMRNHAGKFTKDQEAYRFEGPEDFRSILTLRYRLLPYLYSEFMKASLEGDMFMKPLSFVYEDPTVVPIEDQLMVGDSLMIAPVVTQGATGRRVYLPEPMTMVRWDGDTFTCEAMDRGWREISVPLGQVVFFIPEGKLLPVGKAITNTAQYDTEDLTLLGTGNSYRLYTDDGLTHHCDLQNIVTLTK